MNTFFKIQLFGGNDVEGNRKEVVLNKLAVFQNTFAPFIQARDVLRRRLKFLKSLKDFCRYKERI